MTGSSGKRRGGRRAKGGGVAPAPKHGGGRRRPRAAHTVHETSAPTGRAAYADTRAWLLRTHGPVCAYCGLTYPPRDLTLDHVTPRRGQSAYDRRDNLVLACKRCNSAKADKSFVAWVLGARSRAKHLYVYGQHLSEGILELLRPMVGDVELPKPKPAARRAAAPGTHKKQPKTRQKFGPDHGPSPYAEPSPYLDG